MFQGNRCARAWINRAMAHLEQMTNRRDGKDLKELGREVTFQLRTIRTVRKMLLVRPTWLQTEIALLMPSKPGTNTMGKEQDKGAFASVASRPESRWRCECQADRSDWIGRRDGEQDATWQKEREGLERRFQRDRA
jgi:hypothetical protein